MEPRVSLVTLGVSDLERSVAFYRDGLDYLPIIILSRNSADHSSSPFGETQVPPIGRFPAGSL